MSLPERRTADVGQAIASSENGTMDAAVDGFSLPLQERPNPEWTLS